MADCILEQEGSVFVCSVCGEEEPMQMFKMCKGRSKRKPKNKIREINMSETQETEMPSLVQRVSHFTVAAIKHQIKGNPTCTQEEVDERYEICVKCPKLRRKRGKTFCAHAGCGCNVNSSVGKYLNKLAWADQECPAKPPRWLAIEK